VKPRQTINNPANCEARARFWHPTSECKRLYDLSPSIAEGVEEADNNSMTHTEIMNKHKRPVARKDFSRGLVHDGYDRITICEDYQLQAVKISKQ